MRERLFVGDVAYLAPRVDARDEAALGLPDRAHAGDDALVEQRVADAARLVVRAQVVQERLVVEAVGRQDVRAERGQPLVEAACGRRSSARGSGRRTGPPRAPAVRITSHARRGLRRQRSPRRVTPHQPPMRRCE